MFIKEFQELSKKDVNIAGGKGASLAEIYNAKILVPKGFVILANAFEEFTEKTRLIKKIKNELNKVNINNVETIEKASKTIRNAIILEDFPKEFKKSIKEEFKKLNSEFVAVRSSATAEDSADAAWAGQLDTFLNTTKKDLLKNIKKCWASLFTPRAIFYRFEKGLEKTKVSVAVVVQEMIKSEISGIAFSVHPISEDHNQILIEAGIGLGEAIVSGQITPDNYVIKKNNLEIENKNISKQDRAMYKGKNGGVEWRKIKAQSQKLSDKLIKKLSKIITSIEEHYGFPCDIEWAYADKKIYITQSRPITTLSSKKSKSEKKEIPKYKQLLHHHFPLITAELTDYGETIRNLEWTKEKFEFNPYCVFEIKDNFLYYLYDMKGIEWKIEQAGKFDKEIMKQKAIEGYNKIKEILLNEKALNKKEFLKFIEYLKKFWTWWDLMWFMIEYYDRKKLPINDLLEIRKKTEYIGPGIAGTIRNSLKKIYPDKEELIDGILLQDLKNGLPSDDILRKRMKYTIYTNGKFYKNRKEIEKKYNIQFINQDLNHDGKLTGQTAYKGHAKGIVKIVEKRKDINKFNKGNILVSSTTTPDLLPAIKKAGAILSEHGGAISHAAITSRELKIPCIVGIDGLTKILQDGDYVEVDANKGIVERKEEKHSKLTKNKISKLINEKTKLENKEEQLIKKVKEYFLNKEFSKQEGSFSLLSWGVAASSLESPLYKKYYPTREFGPVVFISKEKESVGFFSFESYTGCAEEGLERFLKGKFTEFEDFKTITKQITNDYKGYPPEIIKKLSDKNMYNLFKYVISKIQDLQIVTLFCEALYEEIVKKYYKKLYSGENTNLEEFFKIASLIFFESFSTQINSTLINFDIKNPQDIQWAFSDYVGTSKIENIKKEAKIQIKKRGGINKIKEENELLKKEIKKNKTKIKKYKEKLKPDLIKLFTFTQETIKIRDLRKKYTFYNTTIISNIGRELLHRKKIPEELYPYIEHNDIKFGKQLKENYQKVLENRKKGSLNYYEENIYEEANINYDKVKKELFEYMDRNKGTQIKGQVAQRGKASGNAKIVLNQKQFKKFKEGEILVTSMTRPEFIPLMKKALAIITDEGGLTCHAAITSRELKIPCITGTQNASRLIKDGDYVEVDANKGIVEIVERKEEKKTKKQNLHNTK